MYKGIVIVAVLLLSGCAGKPTVSENQCRAGDWQTIGYRDGANGVASTRILSHQEACGGFGIFPDRDGYLAGWDEGVASYCTADSGFQLGLRGGSLNSVCSAELREPFATAYADGRQLYSAQREVNRLANLLSNHENRLGQIKQEIVGATTAQLTPDLTVEERLRLLAKLDSLADERATIRAELPGIERALVQAEDQLALLDQTYAAR